MSNRFVGLDIGAETIKAVELRREGGKLRCTRREICEHHKEPAQTLRRLLAAWDWASVSGAAATGRLGRQVTLTRVPAKQAQAAAFRFLEGDGAATVVSIGSHGFTVLELRPGAVEVLRENSRCSQGTGNFLRQLVERFNLSIEEASALCEGVEDPAPLSGRCPVILKTDMTHLANKGESRARILAGLYDAVCENVQVLIKPRLSPRRVMLAGGVARSSRIRENFRRFLARHEMELVERGGDDGLYLEALGCALSAAGSPVRPPELDALFAPAAKAELEELPALAAQLARVKRMPAEPLPAELDSPRDVVLGFDIGSTGSKAVALEAATRRPLWEGYLRTNGDPVCAAQALMRQFVEGPAGGCRVRAAGATGSGREIVGSLMSTCYGPEAVYVLNEIAAHAAGAVHFDPRVDTIFEIGGQDAKYIRLADGRVIDAAMNEACSAGTGSFIEEQGRRFSGIDDVRQLAREALEAEHGVSLGQHCSVFMAEIIEEAVCAGAPRSAIAAGIYDSIIQNYLNRVKGSRSVGSVIFCQGMPFAADALAAAVARQTGGEVIVPPNPGTVGALGIALLALDGLGLSHGEPLDPRRFLEARVEQKDTFVCRATSGCGGAGNKCRIDRISTVVDGERRRFTWGGGCSLHDKGTRKRKLPDLAPDPFREREQLLDAILGRVGASRGGPKVAMTDEFALKGLFPFFATFLSELGFDLLVHTGADQQALKRGIESANVPYCAPMQQYRGLIAAMVEQHPDFVFLPMLREITRVRDEAHSVVCPIVQASPDLLCCDLGTKEGPEFVTTLVDAGPGNLESENFVDSCRRIALDFGVDDERWHFAYQLGLAVQKRFDGQLLDLGREALDFCASRGLTPVVVLGRSYTIHNSVLNSNVPAILREQGALAIPVDCYPVDDEVPIFEGMYWSYGQRNLRAAHQIRRTPGQYALYCSNYSCGPDSFTLHFFGYLMDGKPFAVIETDGHSGDAGTKTRVEAFLHCVQQDRAAAPGRAPRELGRLEKSGLTVSEVFDGQATLLIPRMGPGAELVAAALRGIGVRAEALPLPSRETMRLGRRHTSGKECVPMTITLGSLLQRLEAEPDRSRRFGFLMPTAYGPCRFGAYNLLNKVVLERLGWAERVKVVSPGFSGYFDGFPDGFPALAFASFMASDLLLEALYDVRPAESIPGEAERIYARYKAEACELLEEAGHGDLSAATVLLQIASGNLFGVTGLLARAGAEFTAIRRDVEVPRVMLVGEIYVRCDPFANDFVVEKLEQRGVRVRFAPFTEWLEYADYINSMNRERTGFLSHLSTFVRGVIQSLTYAAMAEPLGWPERTSVRQSLQAAAPFLREQFQGESVLTLGGPLHEWHEGRIDGVVSTGPLECMPNKIAEAQFFHVAEREGLPSLTLSLNGDPLGTEALDNFAFEIRARFRERQRLGGAQREGSRLAWQGLGKSAVRNVARLAAFAFPGAQQVFGARRRGPERPEDSSAQPPARPAPRV